MERVKILALVAVQAQDRVMDLDRVEALVQAAVPVVVMATGEILETEVGQDRVTEVISQLHNRLAKV